MDVYEQARAEAEKRTSRQIRRDFSRAAASFTEYAALCDMEQAMLALHVCNCLLDVYNERRRGKR